MWSASVFAPPPGKVKKYSPEIDSTCKARGASETTVRLRRWVRELIEIVGDTSRRVLNLECC